MLIVTASDTEGSLLRVLGSMIVLIHGYQCTFIIVTINTAFVFTVFSIGVGVKIQV